MDGARSAVPSVTAAVGGVLGTTINGPLAKSAAMATLGRLC